MKETTPANKKARVTLKHNASTHHGHEQAASGANTSSDPLGAYKLPELPKVELPELPQPPDPAQLLAENKAHLEEVTRQWDEYNKPENVRAGAEQALANYEARLEEVAQQVRAKPELSPLPALPDLKHVNVEAVIRDVDAASVQAVNVIEELAERDAALFESLDTQGGDVID